MSIGDKFPNASDTLTVQKNAMQEHPLTTPLGKIGWIDDVFTTHWDDEKPISAGFFTVQAGEPLDYTCTQPYSISSHAYAHLPSVCIDGYNELKLVVEGTVVLEDKTKGTKIVGHPGDVLSSQCSHAYPWHEEARY